MPCNTVRMIAIDLKVANFELFLKALDAKGIHYRAHAPSRTIAANSWVWENGKLTYAERYRATVDQEIKSVMVQYSKEILQSAAELNGWQVEYDWSPSGQLVGTLLKTSW
jgi:hypothetical protein